MLIRYLLKRLLYVVPMLFGITLLTFLLIRLVPGNPVYSIVGENATPALIQAATERLGLDKPLHEQYLLWLASVARGDLGNSWATGQPVLPELIRRAPATFELLTVAWIVGISLGVFTGVVAALNKDRWPDHVTRVTSVLGISIPSFWLGLLLIFILFVNFKVVAAPLGRLSLSITPPPTITGFLLIDSLVAGRPTAFWDALSHLVLPALTGAFLISAPLHKQTRSAVLDVLNSDFIRYARASGLPARQIRSYALRNALIPVITRIGIIFSHSLGGVALVEVVFAWGGIGQYGLDAAVRNDFSPIQGFVLFAAVFAAVVYLAVDLLYPVVDPRIELA
jgi:peptide/nickel transport system permease protein